MSVLCLILSVLPFFSSLLPFLLSLFTHQPLTLCWFNKGLVDKARETDGNCLEIVGGNVGGSIWGIWESGHSYVANKLNLRTVESENSEKLKENKDLWSRSGKKMQWSFRKRGGELQVKLNFASLQMLKSRKTLVTVVGGVDGQDWMSLFVYSHKGITNDVICCVLWLQHKHSNAYSQLCHTEGHGCYIYLIVFPANTSCASYTGHVKGLHYHLLRIIFLSNMYLITRHLSLSAPHLYVVNQRHTSTGSSSKQSLSYVWDERHWEFVLIVSSLFPTLPWSTAAHYYLKLLDRIGIE